MTVPKISVSSAHPSEGFLVIAAETIDGKVKLRASHEVGKSVLAALEKLVVALSITGAADSFCRVVNPLNPQQVLGIVGVGSGPVTASALRYAAGVAVRQLAGEKTVIIDFDAQGDDDILATTEGAALGAYQFSTYRSSRDVKNPVKNICIIGSTKNSRLIVESASSDAQAVALVKDMVNTPPNDLYPESFVARAKKELVGLPVDIKVWDEKSLAKDGYGGILAVGQGSSRPPRLMKLTYKPAHAKRTIALVGKGITFDSGGLSLKSGVNMVGMKYDMTGAASALAIVRAAAKQKLSVAITAWLCLAENMPSGTAQRPNDVIKTLSGTTVEVLNTDAEGRLVLADGLTAASREKPDIIIDIATLTGASSIALGHRYTGAMGDATPISRLVEISNDRGEFMWHMPLPEELRSMLNSDVADIANVKIGSTSAGMLVGATFLKEFVGKQTTQKDSDSIPWVHLDIASTSHNNGAAYGFTGAGPTGVTVRSLIRFAKDYAVS